MARGRAKSQATTSSRSVSANASASSERNFRSSNIAPMTALSKQSYVASNKPTRRTKCDLCKKLPEDPACSLFMEDKLGRVNSICRYCLDMRYSIVGDSSSILKDDEVFVWFKNKVRVKYKKLRLKTHIASSRRKNPAEFDKSLTYGTKKKLLRRQAQAQNIVTRRKLETRDKKIVEFPNDLFTCRFCDLVFVAGLAIKHAASHCTNIFPCCFCRNEFNDDISLEQHLVDDHKIISQGLKRKCSQPIESFPQERYKGSENIDLGEAVYQNPEAVLEPIDEDGVEKVKDCTDFTEKTHIDDMMATPEEEVAVNELLSQYDITDIDLDILNGLKANILETIRASVVASNEDELDACEFEDSFQCTDCQKQFDSFEAVCNHRCAKANTGSESPPFNSEDGELPCKIEPVSDVEALDSDQDPEWLQDSEDFNETGDDTDSIVVKEQALLPMGSVTKVTAAKKSKQDAEGSESAKITSKEPAKKNDMPKYKHKLLKYTPRSIPSECEHCGLKFKSKVRLQFHMKYHVPPYSEADEIIYDCSHCPALNFNSETELYHHFNVEHKPSKELVCPYKSCQRTYNRKNNFNHHLKTHSGIRRFVCSVCDKRFLDKHALVEHSVVHMKDKPFQCHVCLQYMTRRSRLRDHLKTHNSVLVTNAVYACKTCQMGFKYIHEAKEHALTLNGCITNLEATKEREEDTENIGVVEVTSKEFENHMNSGLDQTSHQSENFKKAIKMFSELTPAAQDILKVSLIDIALRCHYCETVYITATSLRRHWKVHDGVKLPFVCNVCKANYSTYARMAGHKACHSHSRLSSADRKLEEFPFIENVNKPDLTQPEQRNPDLRKGTPGYFPVVKHFLCNECDKTYLHFTSLQIHKNRAHSMVKKYKCKICGEPFRNSWNVAHHRRKVHNIIPAARIDPNNPGREVFTCKDCGEVASSKSLMDYHKRAAHADYACTKCPFKFVTRAGLERHLINKHKNEDIVLVKDDYELDSFGLAKRKKVQFDSATAKGEYKCNMCDKTYLYAACLQRHKKQMHATTRSHTCQHCEKVYFSQYDLDQHVLSHFEDWPFKCSHCDKGFFYLSLRNAHEKTHLNVRPFQCDKCGSSFLRKSGLQVHLLLHSGTKKFICSACPRRFWNISALNFHMRKKHSSNSTEVDSDLNGARKSSGLSSLLSQDSGDGTLISQKNAGEETIVAAENGRGVQGLAMSKNVLEEADSGSEYTLIKQELTEDRQEITTTVAVMEEDEQSEDRQMDPSVEQSVNVCNEDNIVLMADGKIIIGGEVYQLENTNGEPLNLENAVIKLDEHGRLIIQDPEIEVLFNQSNLNSKETALRPEDVDMEIDAQGAKLTSITRPAEKKHQNYKSHKRSNTDKWPFKCSICGKGFLYPSLSTRHERMHQNVRPFQCDKCNKAFRRKSALQVHLMLHTGEKQFICLHCDRSFWNRSTLKFHIRQKHPSEYNKAVILLKVNGTDLSDDNIVEQLKLYEIPKNNILSITELKFKKGTILPRSLDLSTIRNLGATSIDFKDDGKASLISVRGVTVASELKKPIVPVIPHTGHLLKRIMLKNVLKDDGSRSDDVLISSRELIVDGQNADKEIAGGGPFNYRRVIKMPVLGETASEMIAQRSSNVSHDNLAVMADREVVVQGEVYRLENNGVENDGLENDLESANFGSAVVAVNEEGQLIIRESVMEAEPENSDCEPDF